jgi:hypothetical protein
MLLGILASSKANASSAAYELIDWIRIIQPPLHHTEVDRFFDVIIRFSPSAAREFLYQLDPQLNMFWSDSNNHRLRSLEKQCAYFPHI